LGAGSQGRAEISPKSEVRKMANGRLFDRER